MEKYRIEKIDYPPRWFGGKAYTHYYPQYSYKTFFTRKIKWKYFERQELEEVGGQLHLYNERKKFGTFEEAKAYIDDIIDQQKTPVSIIIDYP